MSDFRLQWQGLAADLVLESDPLSLALFQVGLSGMNDAIGGWEWAAVNPDGYVSDAGLEGNVLISLFTDRQAEASDVLPDQTSDRGGWWASAAAPVADGDKWGSRLWLLYREVLSQSVLDRSVEYVREALQWMITDQVLDRIEVSADYWGTNGVQLTIDLYRPTKELVRYRFNRTWEAQAARG